MTIKEKRTSIREATKPGIRIQKGSPRPEQPVSPDGRALGGGDVTYEALTRYHRAAEDKLGAFRSLVEDTYRMLSDNKVDAAKQLLHDFDRTMPRLEKPNS